MTVVAGTYLIVCLAIGAYAVWVWTRQRRLARRLRELREQVRHLPPPEELRSKAA